MTSPMSHKNNCLMSPMSHKNNCLMSFSELCMTGNPPIVMDKRHVEAKYMRIFEDFLQLEPNHCFSIVNVQDAKLLESSTKFVKLLEGYFSIWSFMDKYFIYPNSLDQGKMWRNTMEKY